MTKCNNINNKKNNKSTNNNSNNYDNVSFSMTKTMNIVIMDNSDNNDNSNKHSNSDVLQTEQNGVKKKKKKTDLT